METLDALGVIWGDDSEIAGAVACVTWTATGGKSPNSFKVIVVFMATE